jgi:ATP-dependent DNA helicase RecG
MRVCQCSGWGVAGWVDDAGKVLGIEDAAKLLEDIPNKVRDLMGLVVPVNLKKEGEAQYLEVCVEPYPWPVSLRGKYYQRTGSTNQELKGAALDRFILRKQGKNWDGVPVPQVAPGELSGACIARFRKYAQRSGRMAAVDLRASDAELLDKLKLKEGDYLKRAAVLLFHPDPERFVGGAFIKIGFFRSESDLVYHDEVHGDLFSQVEQCVDLIQTKYFKAAISYVGLQRIETWPVPDAALREALLNAVVHRDYGTHAPIQIRIYPDRMKLWNPAVLPEGWDIGKLLGEHASKPFNPDIANTFFRAGEIEAWGRGIHRIFQACKVAKAPKPRLRYESNDLWLEFPFSKAWQHAVRAGETGKAVETTVETGKTTVETTVEMGRKTNKKTPEAIMEILESHPQYTLQQVAELIGKTIRPVENAAKKLIESGRLRRVGPKKGGHWEVIR